MGLSGEGVDEQVAEEMTAATEQRGTPFLFGVLGCLGRDWSSSISSGREDSRGGSIKVLDYVWVIMDILAEKFSGVRSGVRLFSKKVRSHAALCLARDQYKLDHLKGI